MENLISKELLSQVLKVDIRKINHSILDGNLYYYKSFVKCKSKINIYELAHLCKEWANLYNFYIKSSTVKGTASAVVEDIYKPNELNIWFHSDTEVEAIIRASEWVRKELIK